MKKSTLITALITAALTAPAFGAGQPFPIIDMITATCNVPQTEILGEKDEFLGYNAHVIKNCGNILTNGDGMVRGEDTVVREVTGPDNRVVRSSDYTDELGNPLVPCILRDQFGQVFYGWEWKARTSQVPGGTRFKLVCKEGELLEPEEVEVLAPALLQ